MRYRIATVAWLLLVAWLIVQVGGCIDQRTDRMWMMALATDVNTL